MGDIDHRRLDIAMQPGDFGARLHAQRRIEVGKRLVEQEDIRLAHDGAADGDALALAAGKLFRLAVEIGLDGEHARRLVDAIFDFRPLEAQVFQTEGEVLAHAHMRIKRIGLEDHGDLALGWRQRADIAIADGDGARCDVLETGDDAQQRRFSAARGADENDEFAVFDLKIDVMQHMNGAERLVEVFEFQTSHHLLPLSEPVVATISCLFQPSGKGIALLMATSCAENP
ncbi:hypothetical protein D3C78_817950 [compost metagenome]